MIRALKHDNIIQLEDVFSDTNTLFLVMELVRGGDLFDRIIKRGRYKEHEARVVMFQVLSAMQFMHDKNVAHRDMKPENILLLSLDSDIDVKITDFGLAKSAKDSGGLKTYCGTPHYFAPEVQNQRGVSGSSATTYGFAADMWSVGVIAYVLLTGDYPWSADHNIMCQEIERGQANYRKHAAVWSSLSSTAFDFVQQLIMLDPNARLTAAQALEHPWLGSVQVPLSPASHKFSPPLNENNQNEGEVISLAGQQCSNVRMPPPVNNAVPKQGHKGTKRKAGVVAEAQSPPQRCSPQGRSVKPRVPSSDHVPMEISLTTDSPAAPSPGRGRLPRRAKQSSIGQYCYKK